VRKLGGPVIKHRTRTPAEFWAVCSIARATLPSAMGSQPAPIETASRRRICKPTQRVEPLYGGGSRARGGRRQKTAFRQLVGDPIPAGGSPGHGAWPGTPEDPETGSALGPRDPATGAGRGGSGEAMRLATVGSRACARAGFCGAGESPPRLTALSAAWYRNAVSVALMVACW
jgi:hypothetical protein